MCCKNLTAAVKSKYNILRQRVPYLINIVGNADVSLENPVEKNELSGTQIRMNTQLPLLNVALSTITVIAAAIVVFGVKKAVFHTKYKKRFN